jgi:hypothetical protein
LTNPQDDKGMSKVAIEDQVKELNLRISSLKERLSRPFTVIEASSLAPILDIKNVNKQVKFVYAQVGKTLPIIERQHESVWTAVSVVSDTVSVLAGNVQDVTHVINTLLQLILLFKRLKLLIFRRSIQNTQIGVLRWMV